MGEMFASYDPRAKARTIMRPILWTTSGGQYVVLDNRAVNKNYPYPVFHVGTGKSVPTGGSNLLSFHTQKINKEFAQWFEDQHFFDDEGRPLRPTGEIRGAVAAWGWVK